MSKFILFIILIFALSADGQTKRAKFSASVKIEVGHDSDKVENEMYKHLVKEVLALNNDNTHIILATSYSKQWDYTIRLAMVDVMVGGNKFGYASAVVISRRGQCKFDNTINNQEPTEENCNAVQHESVTIFSADHLENQAKEIVNDFKKVYGLTRLLFEVDKIVKPSIPK